jgi:plastocyanin
VQPASHGAGTDARKDAVPNEVVIDNFAYQPAKLVVKVGTKVTWVNRDDVPHTATSSTKPRAFDSGTLDTDGRFSHVFPTPGDYEYFCAVHPHMTGRIIVQD